MYIFGGGFISGLRGLYEGLVTLTTGGEVTEAVVNSIAMYFLTEHLPPTSLEQVIMQSVVGAVLAAILWYIAVPKRGR